MWHMIFCMGVSYYLHTSRDSVPRGLDFCVYCLLDTLLFINAGKTYKKCVNEKCNKSWQKPKIEHMEFHTHYCDILKFIYTFLIRHVIIWYAPWHVRRKQMFIVRFIFISQNLEGLAHLSLCPPLDWQQYSRPSLGTPFLSAPIVTIQILSMNTEDLRTVNPFQSKINSVSNLLKWQFLCILCCSATLHMKNLEAFEVGNISCQQKQKIGGLTYYGDSCQCHTYFRQCG